MNPTINIYEAKTRFSALVAEIEESGVPVTICRNGKPVAELRPLGGARRRRLVPDPSLKVRFAPGFDPTEPLDPEDLPDAMR